MMDTDTLGTEAMPYDPENPLHKAIVDAEDVIKMAEEETKEEVTLGGLHDAIKELTTQTAEMAKQLKTMNEAQAKWIKAGKF
jgi:hypothetical protein